MGRVSGIQDPDKKPIPDPGSATLNDSTRTAEIPYNLINQFNTWQKPTFYVFHTQKNLSTVKTAQDKLITQL
jgi:hypothetical protein